MKIELREKVRFASGEEKNVVFMREPTRGDLKAVENIQNNIEKEDMLLSRLTGISIAALDSMVMADSAKLQDALIEVMDAGYDPKS